MILQKLQSLLNGKGSLIYLVSDEEERVERLVMMAAQKNGGGPLQIYKWSCLYGLFKGREVVANSSNPVQGLGLFMKVKEPSILIFKDLHLFVENNALLIRQIKDCGRILRSSPKKIFFISYLFLS